jgi:hypothetical protein
MHVFLSNGHVLQILQSVICAQCRTEKSVSEDLLHQEAAGFTSSGGQPGGYGLWPPRAGGFPMGIPKLER